MAKIDKRTSSRREREALITSLQAHSRLLAHLLAPVPSRAVRVPAVPGLARLLRSTTVSRVLLVVRRRSRRVLRRLRLLLLSGPTRGTSHGVGASSATAVLLGSIVASVLLTLLPLSLLSRGRLALRLLVSLLRSGGSLASSLLLSLLALLLLLGSTGTASQVVAVDLCVVTLSARHAATAALSTIGVLQTPVGAAKTALSVTSLRAVARRVRSSLLCVRRRNGRGRARLLSLLLSLGLLLRLSVPVQSVLTVPLRLAVVPKLVRGHVVVVRVVVGRSRVGLLLLLVVVLLVVRGLLGLRVLAVLVSLRRLLLLLLSGRLALLLLACRLLALAIVATRSTEALVVAAVEGSEAVCVQTTVHRVVLVSALVALRGRLAGSSGASVICSVRAVAAVQGGLIVLLLLSGSLLLLLAVIAAIAKGI